MSERGRILLICGAVVVLLGGGGFYFFKVYQPAETQRRAQAEIERWELRLAKARACLLGSTPGSSNVVEALAIRELSPDPWDRGTCTKLVSELSRGDAEDSGLLEVEEAWQQIDKAARHVALSFLTHVDPGGELENNRGGADPLPGALEAMDKAHASLRSTAGMEPPVLPGGTQPLRAVEVTTVLHGKQPLTGLDSHIPPSVGALVGFGRTQHERVQVTLAGGPASVAPIANFTRRSVTDPTWGSRSPGCLDCQAPTLEIGTIDASGTVQPTTTLTIKHRKPARAAMDEEGFDPEDEQEVRPEVTFMLGDARSGVLVYSLDNELSIVRSVNGALTTEKPTAIEHLSSAIDPAGRALVAWSTPASALSGMILSAGTPTTVVPLGEGRPMASCLTTTRGWIATEDDLVAFDGKAVIRHPLPGHELVACNATAALFRSTRLDNRYLICTAACRSVAVKSRPRAIPALVGEQVVALAIHGPVLAVWNEQDKPLYFSLPRPVIPHMAYGAANSLAIVGESDATVVVVRAPL